MATKRQSAESTVIALTRHEERLEQMESWVARFEDKFESFQKDAKNDRHELANRFQEMLARLERQMRESSERNTTEHTNGRIALQAEIIGLRARFDDMLKDDLSQARRIGGGVPTVPLMGSFYQELIKGSIDVLKQAFGIGIAFGAVAKLTGFF